MRLEPLTPHHLAAVLAFETVNRDYFAATIGDRGDAYFADYPARHAVLLELQVAGTDRFHVLVMADGTIVGRVNLTEIRGGEAEIGYRIGRDFTGHGYATEGVRLACELARSAYGIVRLRAGTAVGNIGSQTVLLRNGFTPAGQTTLAGPPTLLFARQLN